MNILCRLGFHKLVSYHGCRCRRCFDDFHKWSGCRCQKCGEGRDIAYEGHKWDGCKCLKCDKTRDEGHKWDGCKCLKCDKTRDKGHKWDARTCVVCGQGRPLPTSAKPKPDDLNEDQEYDLILFQKWGFVRVNGSGESITKIYAEVENLINKRLCAFLEIGTYFTSLGGHQNMAATAGYTIRLNPFCKVKFDVPAVCINANRPVPGNSDRFGGVSMVSDKVALFLKECQKTHFSAREFLLCEDTNEACEHAKAMVIQAGVWALTDNYSRHDIINHLILKDSRGNISHPINSMHIMKAARILLNLRICPNSFLGDHNEFSG